MNYLPHRQLVPPDNVGGHKLKGRTHDHPMCLLSSVSPLPCNQPGAAMHSLSHQNYQWGGWLCPSPTALPPPARLNPVLDRRASAGGSHFTCQMKLAAPGRCSVQCSSCLRESALGLAAGDKGQANWKCAGEQWGFWLALPLSPSGLLQAATTLHKAVTWSGQHEK